ncbi:helix-turn-helix domain-containing protein [Nocardia bovistercoris]|uniref:helix-turn-helix domain-containing protein n=1 Tax=Nocardia bovistercoris TaxID=2785916 RepID=UPI001E58D0F4|nr:helix-turn-helix transcriptional regulator [Nocardia bovistercoris]
MRRERLIEARKATGKTQEQIADEVEVDRTTLGRWERNEGTPHPSQRIKYAEALGITMDELSAMLSSVPSVEGEVPEWLSTYLGMEQSATAIRCHEPRAVYGLLQIPSYVEALVGRIGISGVSDTYIRQAVDQRLHRQKRVRSGELVLDVIMPESALRLHVGTPAVMAEQLSTLAELSELPNVTVRVTTYAAGQYEARRLNCFSIMSHPWGSPRVHFESYAGGRWITDAEEVGYFAGAYDHGAKVALNPTESRKFITELAKEWENRG